MGNSSVAIVLLNWNSYQLTVECLESLEKLNYPDYHIFIVDNDSQDSSFEDLKKDYMMNKFNLPITFMQSGANLGFAGGNNVAIKKAYEMGYPYIWMLNNDTVVEANSLSTLVEAISKDTKTGIVGSKILYYDTDLIWYAGGTINTWTGKTKHLGYKERDIGQYNSSFQVDYVTGCSLLFKRELIDSIGLMQEDYFLYYEETDWNIRAKQENWKIVYVPDSVVYHKVSISSGGEDNLSPYVEYYYIRNSYIMIRRTQSMAKIITATLLLFLKLIKSHLKILIKKQDNKINRSKLIIKAFFDGIIMKTGKL